MKMTLTIVADTLEEIQLTLRQLSYEHLESNCCGGMGASEFDYDFVDSDDLYSDDTHLNVMSPYREN